MSAAFPHAPARGRVAAAQRGGRCPQKTKITTKSLSYWPLGPRTPPAKKGSLGAIQTRSTHTGPTASRLGVGAFQRRKDPSLGQRLSPLPCLYTSHALKLGAGWQPLDCRPSGADRVGPPLGCYSATRAVTVNAAAAWAGDAATSRRRSATVSSGDVVSLQPSAEYNTLHTVRAS